MVSQLVSQDESASPWLMLSTIAICSSLGDRVFKARSTVLLAAYQSVFARLRHGFTPTAEITKSVR